MKVIVNRKFRLVIIVVLLIFSVGFGLYGRRDEAIFAQEDQSKLTELNNKIEEYEREVVKLQTEANTLSNQIAQYDAQINLTTLRINQTEEKISNLKSRIKELEVSLNSLNVAFEERVNRTYKLARLNKSLLLVVSANDLPDTVTNFHYLERIQEADQDLLVRLEDAQERYEGEKIEQEELQDELEGQQTTLEGQKSAKNALLIVTRNDERRYQSLLSTARAEKEAIQSIIAGKGEETLVGAIGEGSRIASVIPGSSACSNGAHLHFEVAKDKMHINPASLLSSRSVSWDNAPDGSFDFTGSWSWPINDPIRITQGYGMTYYAANLRYYGGAPHTGIDMINTSDYSVKAVKPGTLYQGGIKCGGGILRYVRVAHDDGYSTYYLHVNY